MVDKPIKRELPLSGATIALLLEEGTVDVHRRVLMDDLEDDPGYSTSFIKQMELVVENNEKWDCIEKKVKTMTIWEIKTFSGY